MDKKEKFIYINKENFPDDNLREALKSHLRHYQVDENNPDCFCMYSEAYGKIDQLILSDKNIKSIIGIEKFTDLKYLDISDNKIRDLEPLNALKKLGFLDISMNEHLKLGFEDNLQLSLSIKVLLANYCHLNDKEVSCLLHGLWHLEKLYLKGNEISLINKDGFLNYLRPLYFLKELDLSKNKISDLYCLNSVKDLEWLDLSNNKISDISIFNKNSVSFNNLHTLNLSGNKIKNFSSLGELPELNYLYIKNYMEDVKFRFSEDKDIQEIYKVQDKKRERDKEALEICKNGSDYEKICLARESNYRKIPEEALKRLVEDSNLLVSFFALNNYDYFYNPSLDREYHAEFVYKNFDFNEINGSYREKILHGSAYDDFDRYKKLLGLEKLNDNEIIDVMSSPILEPDRILSFAIDPIVPNEIADKVIEKTLSNNELSILEKAGIVRKYPLPEKLALKLSRDDNDEIRNALAGNECMTGEMLRTFAERELSMPIRNPDYLPILGIVRNPNNFVETLEYIAEKYDGAYKKEVLEAINSSIQMIKDKQVSKYKPKNLNERISKVNQEVVKNKNININIKR